MAKKNKLLDERYMGTEPSYSGKVLTPTELANAYNWYNYFHAEDEGKKYFLAYVKSQKFSPKDAKKLAQVDALEIRKRALGWNSRIMSMGGVLPVDMKLRFDAKIKELLQLKTKEEKPEVEKPKVVSVIDRTREKASGIIADIEGAIDDGDLNVKEFFLKRDIKAPVAKIIADHFRPQYSELWDAYEGKNEQLVEAYASWKPRALKKHMELMREIVANAENKMAVAAKSRKPRKKKEKTPAMLVKRLQFLEKDKTFKLESIKPEDIIGSEQLWVFNVKYRKLTVFNAMAAAGLSVRGSSITGFDEKTSVTKTLRKPEEQIKRLMEGGKVVLRKFMDEVRCKPRPAKGRINKETLLLRRQK